MHIVIIHCSNIRIRQVAEPKKLVKPHGKSVVPTYMTNNHAMHDIQDVMGERLEKGSLVPKPNASQLRVDYITATLAYASVAVTRSCDALSLGTRLG